MPVIPVSSLEDPRLRDYRDIKDAEGVGRRGVFLVESPLPVLRFAQGSRFTLRSVFVSERLVELVEQLSGLLPPDKPIYTASPALMSEVVGFNIHRGCIAAGDRGETTPLEALLETEKPEMVVAIEALSNAENVGAVFRNAAALGAGLVVVDAESCDPLYRRSIRVSVGTSLTLPFARVDHSGDATRVLSAGGYFTIGLTPDPAAPALAEVASRVVTLPKLALLLGAEGEGLRDSTLGAVDVRARIPMSAGVDSLNVAAASAVALYRIAEARAQGREASLGKP